jgi:general stress protein 26
MADLDRAATPGPMDESQLAEFLARGDLCRISCLDENGWPYSAPVWHAYEEGGLYLVGQGKARWAKYMARNPRVFACIDTLDPVAKVLIKGNAEIVEEPNIGGKWVEIARRMAVRYLGEDGPKYLEPTMNVPRWLIFIRPESIKSWIGNYSRLQ